MLCLLKNKKNKNKKECQVAFFFTSRGMYINGTIIYSDVIHSFNWKSAVEHDGSV